MSKTGTGGAKKTRFNDFTFSSVDENTFKNEKFPELEDPAYPNQLIQELEAQAKEKDQQQKSNHASTPDPLRRRGHYQYRGPAYVHKHKGRGRYNQWPFEYLFSGCDDAKKKVMLDKVEKLAAQRPVWAIVKDSAKWKECFEFPEPGGFPGNDKRFFLTKKLTHKTRAELYFFFTTSAPYRWVAHHLIPIEVFDSKSESHFTDEEQELIRASGYDVNNGHNIVPLPTWDVPPHCLLAHVGSHSEYIKHAKKALEGVKDKIKEAMESDKPHAAFYPQLIKKLTKAEDNLWDKLKDLGKDSVKLYLQGKRPKDNLVKFISKGKHKSTGRRRRFPEGAMN
ncbi:AHH domain-containing protein [Myxococcus sp. RHSTA-1-4]|uniref:AHH domain-containing protein n=1 Tax=Myxococcus sp. RHSTA-1-4 TaxID=2874601 RepID=UPI001CBD211E|nr:AHH domain-containing protein [Myxococcus sp. RHSTA-1-4]MBZ4417607.1 AHH domain-containing protein [Myxococcus sp. RHSTA-1-4]